jgi:hypothetical protein
MGDPAYRSWDMETAKVVKEILSDRSVVWNVEYTDMNGLNCLTVGCVDRNAATLLAECLNDASWVQVECGETLGRAWAMTNQVNLSDWQLVQTEELVREQIHRLENDGLKDHAVTRSFRGLLEALEAAVREKAA